MPGMHGLELQEVLVQRNVELPVVVLTAYGDIATTRTALKNGAADFLEKPVDDDVLIDVLRNAIRLDEARHRVVAERTDTLERLNRLTPRERAVLNLLAEGLQHRDIAERLQISPRTVEVYKARMMEKLHVRSLAEMVRLGSVGSVLCPQ
jgi:FixJ family two-component response regulator